MFDLRITESSSELFAIEMKGELNATEAGDEQQGAAPFGATGLPAVAEEGFALEVAVEFVGELDAEVLEDVFFEVHSDEVRLRMGLELPPFRRLAVGLCVFFIVFFIFLVGMCCGSGKLLYLCGEKVVPLSCSRILPK